MKKEAPEAVVVEDVKAVSPEAEIHALTNVSFFLQSSTIEGSKAVTEYVNCVNYIESKLKELRK